MNLSFLIFTCFSISLYPFYVFSHYLQHKKLKKKTKRQLKLISYFSLVFFTFYTSILLFQSDLSLSPNENIELLASLFLLTQVLLFSFICLGLAEFLERRFSKLIKIPVESKNPRKTHGI